MEGRGLILKLPRGRILEGGGFLSESISSGQDCSKRGMLPVDFRRSSPSLTGSDPSLGFIPVEWLASRALLRLVVDNYGVCRDPIALVNSDTPCRGLGVLLKSW